MSPNTKINEILEQASGDVFHLVQRVGISLSPQVKEYMVDACERLGKSLILKEGVLAYF